METRKSRSWSFLIGDNKHYAFTKTVEIGITISSLGDGFDLIANAFGDGICDSSVNYKLVLNISSIFYTIDGSAWTENHTTAVAEKNSEMYNVSNGVKYLIDLNIDNVTTGSINNFYAYDKKTAEANGINTSGLTFNSDGYAIVTKDGVNYIIFNYGNDCHIDSSVSILVYAYNSNGTLVGLKKV